MEDVSQFFENSQIGMSRYLDTSTKNPDGQNHTKMTGKTENMKPIWKTLMKDVDLEEPTSLLDHVNLGCAQRVCTKSNEIVTKYRVMFEAWISAGA